MRASDEGIAGEEERPTTSCLREIRKKKPFLRRNNGRGVGEQ